MKKLIGFIILVAVLALAWFVWPRQSSGPETVKSITPNTSRPDASNATFVFEDGPITLASGTAETNVTPNGEITIDTTLTNDIAYGDINSDGKTDAAVLLVQSGSGSGVFIYAAAYISGNVAYKGSNAVFLGDRISPKSIAVSSGGTVTVTYLDRKQDEPFTAEPTVLTSKSFVYKNGQLVEK